jgi:Acetyltransferase (GNAT) domain
MELESYGSPVGLVIPWSGRWCRIRTRCEFVLHLQYDRQIELPKHHRRLYKKALHSGLRLRRTRTPDGLRSHGVLMTQSMDRRRRRGEVIAGQAAVAEGRNLLECGAAELFQAYLGDVPVSSALILTSTRGGYYHTSGTSPEGMKVGASHFLIASVAEALRSQGATAFNLGGAEEGSSLAEFKERFGAAPVHLTAAACTLGGSWRRWLRHAAGAIRSAR